jgi:hypothetical protein
MDLALKAAKLAAFSFLVFLCITLMVAVSDFQVILRSVQRDIQGVTDKAGVQLNTLNASTSQISNQAAATLKQVGSTSVQVSKTVAKLDPALDQLHADLETADKVENDARLSLDNVNKAAIDERLYFERDLPPLMASIQKDVDGAGDTLAAGKTLLSDSNLKRILANSGDMTESWKKISGDAEYEAHKLTHPDKKKLTFWTATEAGGDYARHFMPSIF